MSGCKFDLEGEAAQDGAIEVLQEVRATNEDARVGLHPGEELVRLRALP